MNAIPIVGYVCISGVLIKVFIGLSVLIHSIFLLIYVINVQIRLKLYMQTFLKKSKILLFSLLTIVVVCAAGSPVAHAATTYTDTDIYNLLYAALYGTPAEESPYMPKSIAWHLDRLVNNNLYYHQQFNSKLSDIKTAIQNISGSSSPTYKELQRIADMMLYGFDRSDPDAPMPCMLMDMNDNLLKLRDIVTNTNYLSSINSNINSLKTNVSDFNDNVSLGLSVSNDKLTEISSSLSLVDWSDNISNLLGVKINLSDSYLTSGDYSSQYLYYYFSTFHVNSDIYHVRMPLYLSNNIISLIDPSFDFGIVSNNRFVSYSNAVNSFYTLTINSTNSSGVYGFIDLYFIGSLKSLGNQNFVVRCDLGSSRPFTLRSDGLSGSFIRRLSIDNPQYYSVADYIVNSHSNSILKDFKYLYADEAAIKKKQESSSQSSAALDAFSGDGSAAASVGNITDAAGISSSLSSSLSTGVSADAALSSLDGSSYGFWSQSVSDNINSLWVPSSPRLLRSSGSDTSSAPEVVDVMDNYHLDLDSLIRRYSD